MPKAKVEGLLTQLHERFASSDSSPQQEALLRQLQSQLDGWDGPLPADGDIVGTAELLLEEVKELEVLGKLGI
jgi:hypothetical protein